jgi:hypothetical protein
MPYVQRSIDYLAWHAYFWRQASQRFLREADVPFEFEPLNISMLETGQWMQSSTIVERARENKVEIDQAVAELRKEWEKLGDRPSLHKVLKRQK